MADRADYEEFVAGSSARLMRTAWMLTRDWQLAEDLTQEALTKAWFAWRRVQGSPEAYVRKILVTTYISWRRRRWRNELPSDKPPDESVRADAMAAADDRNAVWQALARLAPRQRAVLVLRFYEDLTEAQTADVMGCSVGTVKSQTAKALAHLRVDDSLTMATDAEGGLTRCP